ncbi:MAG: alpha/beta fold hydrolase, partial [Chloroflexota bacterium]
MLQASLLGQFDVRLDGQPVDLSSQPAQTLLAYLLLNVGVAVRREQLAGLLWPDSLESSARKNLRNAIWLVRKAIGDHYLVADKTTVAFDPTAPYELDVAVLEEQPPDTDPIALIRAVSVYRGDLLPGYYEDWVQLERERLRGVFERRSQRLLDRLTAAGQWSEVQRWAEHWIALGHVPEPAYRALMISYAAQGDLSHMVSAYRRCVNALEEELDVSPSTETQSLYQRLSQGEVPLKRQPARPQTPAAATDPRQRFVTQEILAVGGHGELFLGVDQLTEKPVVIKRLKKELMTQNPNFVQRFVREGEILRQLNHPNVVQMLAAYEKDGEYCIVMEYVPGGTLRDLLDKTPQLPPAQVLAIGLELADALSRAHHLDVIHRDIKPDNVLLAADGTPRLTDFGMARLERMDARLTQPGAIIGSPAYMSPEALRGESLDARSDIWSFGVLLFEMLAGFHPYDDAQVTAVLIKILNTPTPDLQPHCPDAPPALMALIGQMLVKERNGRIASMRQVAASLEAIRTDLAQGRLTPVPLPPPDGRHSAFDLVPKSRPSDLPTPAAHLVGREQELEALHHWLGQAATGMRQVLFVSGEAGLGKTALVHTFLAQAARHANAWIGYGQCMESRGGGEAYMPVLEALGRLCRGPDGETLVALLDRLAPTWLVQMPWFIGSDENKNGRSSQRHQTEVEILQQRTLGATRERMLREMAELLETVTAEWPLILLLEDLHWADTSTLDLITWLAQRQEPARLLLLGTYRPADAKLHDHPLPDVVQNLRIHRQCAELSLSFLAETAVATYLSGRFPGATLPAGLAQLLYQRTGGNPLFMHNVVDTWLAQESLDVVDGQLCLQVEIEKLAVGVPENLQALIEQQFRQLKQEDRDILKAASVAGMEFSAALVATLLDQAEEEIEARCTTLVRRGTFLRPRGIDDWPDGTVAAGFIFAHHLYRAVLYDRVTAGQQVRLHRQIGKRLEVAYGQQVTEKAAELADHFVRGRDTPRAIKYLQLAAEQALQRSAHQEAMGNIALALELLLTLPETPERMACELTLQAALAPALLAAKGWVASEVEQAYLRARDLARQLGATRQLSSILGGLAVLYEFRGEYQKSQLLMEQRLELPHQPQDTGSLLQSYTLLACSRFHQGSFSQAAEHAQKGLTLYNPEQHVSIDAYYGEEPGIFCHYWAAHALWFLGYPDQAVAKVQNALTLAEELGYKFGLVHAQEQAVHAYQFRREVASVQKWAAATVALAAEQGFPYRQATAMILGGWALAMAGDLNEGLTRLQAGLAAYQATGAKIDTPYYLTLLAEVYGRMKRFDRSLEILDAALALVRNSQGFFYEAEIHRLRGELLWQANGQAVLNEVEASFEQALHLARAQQAKSLELRATMSLARLWRTEGKTAEAHQSLASIYDWFSEGFDSPDLVEARTLLQSLSHPAEPLPTRPPSSSTAALIYRHNLPVQPTAFVGREKELADIRQILEADPSCRLLTLIGPGGSGKTRLSIQVASVIAEQGGAAFTDGLYFVPLASLNDVDAMVAAIASALDLAFYDGQEPPRRQLLEALRTRRLLLLLDNFEHLLDSDSVALVSELLASAPDVKLLTTSRVRLNVPGEQPYTVSGLEIPAQAGEPTVTEAAAYSAIQLFQQHAHHTRPDFKLVDENVSSVVHICRLVQGMPLAIELASAWLKVLSTAEIATEIEQSLDILETEWHNVPERQRSLRAVFNSSWQLLKESERVALQGLAIFQGGFTRQAAQAVTGISLKDILALADSSWLQQTEDGRYQIHPLLRQYAAEKLHADPDAWQQVQEKCSDYYVKFLGEQGQLMWGPRQREAFDTVTGEFENVRLAWDWLVEQHQFATVVDQMLPAMFRYCELRVRSGEMLILLAVIRQELEAHRELDENGRLLTIVLIAQAAYSRSGYPIRFESFGMLLPVKEEILTQAWSLASTLPTFDALGYWGTLLAYLYGRIINREAGIERLRHVVERKRQEDASWEVAFALEMLAHLRLRVYKETAERAETEAYLSEALAIFESLGDEREGGYTMRQLGQLRRFQHAYADAIYHWQAAQARLQAVGDWPIAAEINWQIGDAYLQMGNFEAGFRHYRQMSDAYLAMGYRQEVAHILSKESYETLRYGEPEHARQTRQRCLDLARETGAGFAEAWSTWEMGEIYRVTGEYDAARRWYEDARLLFEKVDEPARHIFYHRGLGDIARALGNDAESEQQFRQSIKYAQELSHEWGICYALGGLVRALVRQRQFDAARAHLAELLRRVVPLDEQGILLTAVAAAAGLYAALGNNEYAAELCALVSNHPVSWRETKAEVAALLETIKAQLPSDSVTAAQERGSRSDLWQTADELVNDLQGVATQNVGTQSVGTQSVGTQGVAMSVPHNLTTRLAPLVGREKELAEIERLLAEADGRLLTLIGPGGIGKTRLALAVGTAVMTHFPDGVFFVPLAPLHSAEHIVTILAESVDFHFQDTDGSQQQLLNYLSQKQMLLIMDNYEHLLDGTDLLTDILQRAPQVKILVTSRERLNLSHEVTHSVGGLEFPDWATPVETPTGVDVSSYSAVQLLLQRVRQARPDFEPQPQDLRDAGRICRLVQGMPLAIVLAAGWLEILSLREIGNEIAQNLDFLETEMQDLPLRQRSVRAVFDASWKRLPAGDQEAFKKLSSFRGGFTRQAAQTVANASLKTLRTLANNSFITVGRENRYEIHELLRQYGQEYLEATRQAEQVQAAHTDYYLKMLARLEADIRGKNQAVALNDIAADFENIRLAWEQAVQQQLYSEINSALETLHLFMDMRGRQQEGADLFRAACLQLAAAAVGDSNAEIVKMRLLLRYRFMQMVSTRQPGEEVIADLETCLAIGQQHKNEAEVALAQSALGSYKMMEEDDARAGLDLLMQAYDRFVALQDNYFTTLAMQWLGLCHYQLGNREQFLAYTRQSMELARQNGNKVVQAYSQINLAENALMQGEYKAVESYLQDTILIADKMRLHVLLTHSKLLLATLHLFNGKAATAGPLLAEAFELAGKLNYSVTLALAYGVRALMDSVAGSYASANQFGEDSVAIFANHGLGLMIARCALAMTHCGQQQPELAWQQARMVMKQIQQEGFVAPQTWLLPLTAVLLAHSGANERAVELLALAHTHPLSPTGWLAHWRLLAEARAGLKQELGTDIYQAAWARGQGLDLDTVVTELLALESLPETAVGVPAPSVEQEIRFCVSADSVRLAYATVGEGPPLVKAANWLSHLEFDLSSSIWRHWIQGLSRQHTLLRYDERGCGLSSWEIDDFSIDAWVQDLEAVVAATGLERFPLFGISQGAAVAIAYAARHPQKVSHLILCGGFVRGFRKQSLPPEQLELTEAILSLVKSGWGRSNPAFRQLFSSLFIPGATAEQMRWFNDLQRVSTSPENAFSFLNAFYDLDVTHLAAQVQAPALILHARRDGVIPFKEGQEIAARIPNARFVSLESRNHILLEDEPAWQQFLTEVQRFVNTPSPPPETAPASVITVTAAPPADTTDGELKSAAEQEIRFCTSVD